MKVGAYMKSIINGFIDVFASLSWIDVVFFMAVLTLIILVVTLIYFIKINEEEEIQNDLIKVSDLVNETNSDVADKEFIKDDAENEELLDLKAITESLEKKENKVIDMTAYEEEQEQRAIISYDELLEKTNSQKINYTDEECFDDLVVKKFDLENLVAPEKVEKPKVNVQLISYQKEEAFLEALKKLQQQIG